MVTWLIRPKILKSLYIYIMILSSTSPYGLLKEFSIACGVSYNAIFRSCTYNFCPWLYLQIRIPCYRLAKERSYKRRSGYSVERPWWDYPALVLRLDIGWRKERNGYYMVYWNPVTYISDKVITKGNKEPTILPKLCMSICILYECNGEVNISLTYIGLYLDNTVNTNSINLMTKIWLLM